MPCQEDGYEWQSFMNGTGYTNVLLDLHRQVALFVLRSWFPRRIERDARDHHSCPVSAWQ